MPVSTLLLCMTVLVAPQPSPKQPPPGDKAPEKAADKITAVAMLKPRLLGPALTSGRVVGFAVDPRNRSQYYVAAASGGVWKTTNSGTTWQPIFDREGSFSIGYITLDPKDSNTLWVGTGENNSQRSVGYGDGVYKSTNGGRTWTHMGLKASEHIGKILIDPRDSNVVYVAAQGPLWSSGGDRGLYKSTDGGKKWDAVLTVDDNTGVTDVILDPANPDHLLAATYQRRRHVWTLINGGPGSAIHRSTDGGKTWKKVTAGLPNTELGRIGLAMAPSDPKIIYAIVEAAEQKGGIFRSADGGNTWERRNPFDSQGQYYSHLVVDPKNSDRIYVMNVEIQVSNDGGRTLGTLPGGNKHVDNHCMWIDPKDTNYYLVGCDGGVYESFDRASSWHYKSNLPITQFYDVGVDQNPASGPFYHVYGGTQDNFTLGGPVRTRSAHGITNADWYVVQGGDGFHCTVDPTDPNIVYAEYQYGGLCRFDRRTGNRVDIRPLTAPGEPPLRWNWDSPLILSPHKPQRLYYAANILFKSEDRGNSWTAISPDLTRQLARDELPVMGKIWGPDAVSKHVSTSFYGNCTALAESPKAEGLIYVGTDDGLIQVTEDGGKTWRKIDKFPGVPERTYVSKLVASQHDAKTVYAAFDHHKNGDFKPYLLKSTDAGKTWTSLAADLPERGTVYSIAEDHVTPKLLFCGTEFGLYVSQDGGKKWQRVRAGLPTIQVKDLVIQRANHDLIIGTFGRGIYVIDNYSPLRSVTEEKLEEPAHLVPPADTVQYIRSAQYGGNGKAFQGESFYTASNPPQGATFVYHLKESFKTLREKRKEAEQAAEKAKKPIKYPTPEELRAEAEEEAAAMTLVIEDTDGEIVRIMSVPATKGVHHVTWDLRQSGATSGARGGSLVIPGKYKATLVKRVRSEETELAGPVQFAVLADPLSSLTPTDYQAIKAYDLQIKELQRVYSATQASLEELNGRLEQMLRSLDAASKRDPELSKKLRDHLDKFKVTRREIQGDRFLSSRNENTPVSLSQRMQYAAYANSGALVLPTATQKQAYEQVQKELATIISDLKALQDKELPELEKRLEAIGAPLPPGRLPSVPK